MRGTQDYAQETNLTRRVSDWEDKLAPVLNEQKKHSKFDMRALGRRIIETLAVDFSVQDIDGEKEGEGEGGGEEATSAQKSTEATFADIVGDEGVERFEVCRMFLSMLQLANDKNVRLVHDVAEAVPFHENEDLESMADKFTDSLRVQLLGTHKAVDFTVAPHSKMAIASKASGVQSKAKRGGSMRSAMSSLNANTLEARRSVM